MNLAMPESPAMSRQRRRACVTLSLSAGLLIVFFAAGRIGGLRVNMTPSEPLGLWRIIPLTRAARSGETVFVCPPDNAAMREARQRGYLRPGLCPGGFAPLIKTVIALAGQRVDVTDRIAIDGVPIASSRIMEKDGQGRSLRHDQSGMVRPGEVYLHSNFIGSWDSRYFGPVPVSGVLGLAQEVLTYAP
ncbi:MULTISPECIES: conjugative transfer signal peptidase TraF [Alphaproteobacteria]|uniref:Conjugal transfer protein TraF n=2 Tax=Alphaproteobacteria TaxID=28211 RepID=A0A512HQB8_9HYPH|nr:MULTISPECIES: conjugative transfer signal peptidase TraF [Alphaproteobacteria]GEO87657.1 conjugal transfer protein TraF [Ciceribacter naphthalenivorans]